MNKNHLNQYYYNKKLLYDNCLIIESFNKEIVIHSKIVFQLPRYSIIVLSTNICLLFRILAYLIIILFKS